jgi:hypothetical protein
MLSNRTTFALSPELSPIAWYIPAVFEAYKDQYDPATNPNGAITLAIAENNLK